MDTDAAAWRRSLDIGGCNENWRAAANFGTNQQVIVEDSTFTYTGGGYNNATVALDSANGACVTFRHNTLTNVWPSQHDTGSQPSSRGIRCYEYYQNTLNCSAGGSGNNCGAAYALRGGTGVIWGNSMGLDIAGVGLNGWNPPATTEIYRIATAGGEPFNFTSGGQTHQVMDLTYESFRLWCSLSPANVCYSNGTSCGGALGTCTDTCTVNISTNKCLANFDGPGTGGSLGYPSRDQNGDSQDGTDASNSQTAAADPTYIWLNTDPNNAGAVITSFVSVAGLDTNYIQANREFYQQGSSFTGATGVGVGLASARPSTCTTGANGPGVGYWETDNLRLDKCSATNTWTTGAYVPFTYPDPLQGTTVGPTLNGRAFKAANLNQQSSSLPCHAVHLVEIWSRSHGAPSSAVSPLTGTLGGKVWTIGWGHARSDARTELHASAKPISGSMTISGRVRGRRECKRQSPAHAKRVRCAL